MDNGHIVIPKILWDYIPNELTTPLTASNLCLLLHVLYYVHLELCVYSIYRSYTSMLYVNGAVHYKCMSIILAMCDTKQYWMMDIIDVSCIYSECVWT